MCVYVCVCVIRQSSTCRIGNVNGEEVYAPFNSLVPCVHPNDVVIGGWDISKTNLADAMVRAGVLPVELQDKVAPQVRDASTGPCFMPAPRSYPLCVSTRRVAATPGSLRTRTRAQRLPRLVPIIASPQSLQPPSFRD
jgi:hypothetical protein